MWLKFGGDCQTLGPLDRKPPGHFPWELDLPGGKYSSGGISFCVCGLCPSGMWTILKTKSFSDST